MLSMVPRSLLQRCLLLQLLAQASHAGAKPQHGEARGLWQSMGRGAYGARGLWRAWPMARGAYGARGLWRAGPMAIKINHSTVRRGACGNQVDAMVT
jgi:hypothetical protein